MLSKYKPDEFEVMVNEEDDLAFIPDSIGVFFMPKDENHPEVDNIRYDDLELPDYFDVEESENFFIVTGKTVDEVSSDLTKMGYSVVEEFSEN